jgi:ketosteroid isomerase-like protein
MLIRTLFVASACGLMLLSPCGAAAEPNDAAVAAIRTADLAWSKAFARKNLLQSVAALTYDASLMAPNHPPVFGHAGVKRALSVLFKQRGLKLGWSPIDVGVADSGDLGYSRGSYKLDVIASGKPVHDRGKYVTIWKKQDGAWKVYLNSFSSDLPAK